MGSSPAVVTLVVLLIVLAVIAGLYVAIHAGKYSGCMVTPGIFDWPKYCV